MHTIRAHKASSIASRVKGLIGADEIHNLYLETRWGIHTFGVKQPIDVLVLDKNTQIVKLKRNLKKNRIFMWNPKFSRILELPVNSIRRREIRVGDRIDLEFVSSKREQPETEKQ